VTFGLGKRDSVEHAVLHWPSGRVEEFKNLLAGRTYECVEGKGIRDTGGFWESRKTPETTDAHGSTQIEPSVFPLLAGLVFFHVLHPPQFFLRKLAASRLHQLAFRGK
jgi:hypothetical protein